jgi:hypothetical protein
VSESPDWTLFPFEGTDYLLGKDGEWRALPADAASPADPK